MSNKKANDGSVPEHVMNLLNEHTLGGFILFYFNSETGEPEQALTFDSPVHSLALQKHISDWSEVMHQLNVENSVFAIQQNIMNSAQDDEDEND